MVILDLNDNLDNKIASVVIDCNCRFKEIANWILSDFDFSQDILKFECSWKFISPIAILVKSVLLCDKTWNFKDIDDFVMGTTKVIRSQYSEIGSFEYISLSLTNTSKVEGITLYMYGIGFATI